MSFMERPCNEHQSWSPEHILSVFSNTFIFVLQVAIMNWYFSNLVHTFISAIPWTSLLSKIIWQYLRRSRGVSFKCWLLGPNELFLDFFSLQYVRASFNKGQAHSWFSSSSNSKIVNANGFRLVALCCLVNTSRLLR